jgi:hypothetical protein
MRQHVAALGTPAVVRLDMECPCSQERLKARMTQERPGGDDYEYFRLHSFPVNGAY